jgi:HTH-type transcriptional regulator/antitoxin HigA
MTKKNEYFPQSVFHPGITLAEKLEELEMGPKEFSIRTGKPEKTISAVINGESSITPDMAVLFEDVLKIPAHFWLNKQRSYDEYLAREKRKLNIKESESWAKLFPVNQMAKLGWISSPSKDFGKAQALFSFFGMGIPEAWQDYYLNNKLKVAFRISLAHTKEPYAISAWLRKGEIQAQELSANEYNEAGFKKSLVELKLLMSDYPADFFKKVQAICLKNGVKVVYTPCLPKAPICGATRWMNDTPIIQLSGRYNRNDSFWFTFFHEVGHIILHGKKDVFLEKVEYDEKDLKKEKEADAFAIEWVFSEKEEMELLKEESITVETIKKYAKRYVTHPAIILGRLQYKKLIHYSVGKEFFEPVIIE